ncbi:unnamed protein product [Acanthosepion pharaonis]|uniref:PX domain-containing protein n=1 Tax=Acanthosepion pharaonis TaxID=158019 RepID=A0A812D576_ACAPH|nr:unnamed protein product [Sepia pharaonis]
MPWHTVHLNIVARLCPGNHSSCPFCRAAGSSWLDPNLLSNPLNSSSLTVFRTLHLILFNSRPMNAVIPLQTFIVDNSKTEKTTLIVQRSTTIYKKGKPKTESYEIRIMSSSGFFATQLSVSVWRSFKEFCWLRRVFLKHYCNQNYDPDVVCERIKGVEEFLQECLQVKQIVSDVMFHLFVQTDLSIKDIKQLGSYKCHPSFLTCFKVCHKGTQDVCSMVTRYLSCFGVFHQEAKGFYKLR